MDGRLGYAAYADRFAGDLGTMDDLRSLAKSLRGNGISLVLDLVLNHVARARMGASGARGQ